MKQIRLIPAAVFVTIVTALFLAAGCDNTDLSSPDTNIPPRTIISGGPRPFTKSSYLVDLKWFGEDSDGEVVAYEFAWDDTTDWVKVEKTDSTFIVNADSCCTYDTLQSTSGNEEISESFFRFHTFFVRSIDDRGALDPSPTHITFNSVTVAPVTRLTGGPIGLTNGTGEAVRFEWEGSDPDSPNNAVVGYEYFHTLSGRLRDEFGYVPNGEGGGGVTRELWNSLDWTRVGAETTFVVLRNLQPTNGDIRGKRHFFFVRSIDEAGAVEQVPSEGVNFVEWGVLNKSTGSIMIRSNVMGIRFSGGAAPEVGEVFEGTDLIFSWGADLRAYGGRVQGYTHAYDDFRWDPWDINDTRFPVSGGLNATRGRHSFFAKVQDDAGLEILGEFPFEVFAGPDPDLSTVLHWNDFYVSTEPDFYPGPDEFLDFWADTLLASFDLIDQFNPGKDRNVVDPPIRRMSAASTLILTTDDFEGDTWPYIQQLHASSNDPIWSYVDAGGNLLLLGFRPSWNFLPDNNYIDTGFVPIPDPCQVSSQPISCGSHMIWYNAIVADSIPHPLYEYCGVETTWLNNSEDFLWSAKSLLPGLPDLLVDSTRSRFLSAGDGLG